MFSMYIRICMFGDWLYAGLNLPNLRVDERLDVLLHVKWTVKEFDTKLTREVRALVSVSVCLFVCPSV